MGLNQQFNFQKFRETKTLEPNNASAKTIAERMATIDVFMVMMSKRHGPEEPDSATTAAIVPDEFLRTPDQREQRKEDCDILLYREKLEVILHKCLVLISRLTIEVHNMQRDEEQGLTWVGKMLVRGIRWWNGTEKSTFEKNLESLQALIPELQECLQILSALPPLPISEPLQKRCYACEMAFFAVESGNQLLIDDDD